MGNLNVNRINGEDVRAGKAVAWANLNGAGTISVRASYNVDSVVDNGTGDYSFNFTNSMANTGYVNGFASNSNGVSDNRFNCNIKAQSPADTTQTYKSMLALTILTGATQSNVSQDAGEVNFIATGDLAQ